MTLRPGVTAVIPFHPARELNGMLERAAASVRAQTYPTELVLARDVHAAGAAVTQQRLIDERHPESTAAENGQPHANIT